MSKPRSLLLLPLLLFAVNFSLMAQDAMKDIHESFAASKGITLNSDTRYADMEIINWDKDEVDILAEIEVDASSKSRAEEKLAKIDVRMGKSGNTINLETDFEEGWSRNAKVSIRIVVKAPSYLNLNLESSYGDLFIQEINGLVLMELKYGNLKADKLGRGNEKPYNQLELGYSNGQISQAGWLELELAYSDLEISTSSMIFCENKYSKLIGEKTGGIVAEGAYDKYYFDEVGSMVAELKYSGIKFGRLDKKLVVESKYTNVKIMELSKDFKEVSASLSYGNLYIATEPGASYKIDAETRYGGLSIAADGKLNRVKENTSKRIWGSVGGAPKGEMELKANYGDITIE